MACARVLLEAGADVQLQRESDKWSPLHAAAALGNVEAVELLLEFDADKTLQDHVLRRWGKRTLYIYIYIVRLHKAGGPLD